jgi:transcriptional regulator with XRE-family HTH domain
MTLAEKLAQARREKGWGVRELARYSGIDAQIISKIETNITLDPRLSTMARLAQALEKPLEYFI